MFLPTFVLCTVTALVAGYGYDDGYYGSKEHESHCKKMKHYNIDPPTNSQLNRKAKFTHLERNGKHYTVITCPSDSFSYALVAESSGSAFNIFGAEYSDAAVLAAGFNVGAVAKCDRKRTTIQTTDGKKINIKKVACIQYTGSVEVATTTVKLPDAPTSTTAAASSKCNTCDITKMLPPQFATGTDLQYVDLPLPGCVQTQVSCIKLFSTGSCSKIAIMMGNQVGQTPIASNTNSMEAVFKCGEDGTYYYGENTGLINFDCGFVC